jgi:hypothetical protein
MKINPIPKITPFPVGPEVDGDRVEVVTLAEHEHVVDHLREQRDSLDGELEAVRRLLDAAPQESAVAAAMKVKRQREWESERIRNAPVVEAPVDGDAQQERKRAEKAEGILIRRAMAVGPGPWNLDNLSEWTGLDRDRTEQALDRLEDEGVVMPEVAGRDRPHWQLVTD